MKFATKPVWHYPSHLSMLLHYLEKLKIQIFCNNKARCDKNATCLHFLPYLLNICRKFEFLISQGSVATSLRWGGLCRMTLVANFIRFPAVQKFWKSVKIWQSYRELKGGNFFLRHSIKIVSVANLRPVLMQRLNVSVSRIYRDSYRAFSVF